jgi:hypothetical protein
VLLNIPPIASAASLRMKTSFTLSANTIPDRGPETAFDLDRIKAEREIFPRCKLGVTGKSAFAPALGRLRDPPVNFPASVSA